MNKARFNLWYFPEDIWMHMNKKQVGSQWRDFYLSTIGRIFQVILEEVVNYKSESGLCQEATKNIIVPIRKPIVDNL